MKFRFYLTIVIISLSALVSAAGAQVNTLIGQVTNSRSDSFAGAISGDGRFVVFESRGDVATENPRNADGNLEIFLWDLAQRRIYQITNTRNLLFNVNGSPSDPPNIRVEIMNVHPVISNDGKWIAFSSNATVAFPGDTTHPPIESTSNPGIFDANAFSSPTPTPTPSPNPTASPSPSPSPTASPTATPTPADNPLTNDGNLEVWLYEIPSYAQVADLSAGDEIAPTNLSPFNADGTPTGGQFVRVTNTFPSQLPRPGSLLTSTFVANDNHDPSISDDGHAIAFVSSRDLVPAIGNSFALNEDNDEIFTYIQNTGLNQVTKTPRGTIRDPIYNKFPTISGPGTRVAFASTGDNPILGMTGGSNSEKSRNEEIFYSDLDASGAPTGTKKQVTVTTPAAAGDVVNILDPGRRMSRDGRYIAFDSWAELENGGTSNVSSFALYVYDTTAGTGAFRRVGPRSTADTAATGGDIAHYPGFTDYDGTGTATTLVFDTRENIKADGTIAATASDGLNPDPARPTQIYSYPLNVPSASATFTRLTKFPSAQTFLASTQPIPSNTSERMTFNLSFTEIGTGNPDLLTEVYYLLKPAVSATETATFDFATGASRLKEVNPTPSPSPSPSASPTPTPTPSPSPSVTPTPVTPSSVAGLTTGMLAVVDVTPPTLGPVTARTAEGSLQRSFTLPIELSGVSVSINGAAAGMKSVAVVDNKLEVFFVVPPALPVDAANGTSYSLVINNNGAEYKTTVLLVAARPDVFTTGTPGPGGRAKMFNVTNRVATTEPFTVNTVLIRGGRLVPSRMRLYLTGVGSFGTNSTISIRIGSTTISGSSILSSPVLAEPGVYYVDFAMPSALRGAGDQPVVVTVTVGGVNFTSRLDDTAPRVSIL